MEKGGSLTQNETEFLDAIKNSLNSNKEKAIDKTIEHLTHQKEANRMEIDTLKKTIDELRKIYREEKDLHSKLNTEMSINFERIQNQMRKD
eukprot:CAMPEP_0116963286 /NCGR_PEP_ID=MMETSP0467-20121206/47813_1 /TAXON_ID=283647 /ORGANISM="Mesodinium pulex, Strain SPMC105" /LENGTH=90 /DNA_ID=CAMNT_0004651871 /DNA_START=211 /DNA_END=483 /DNA_ORIENTATION=-